MEHKATESIRVTPAIHKKLKVSAANLGKTASGLACDLLDVALELSTFKKTRKEAK